MQAWEASESCMSANMESAYSLQGQGNFIEWFVMFWCLIYHREHLFMYTAVRCVL